MAEFQTWDDFVARQTPSAPQTWDDFVAQSSRQSGDTAKGFTRAFAQIPELAYGTAALAAMSAEELFGTGGISTAAKNYFAEKFTAKQAANQQYAPSVDFTDAWDALTRGDAGSMVDWLQDSAGYVVGQGLQTVATGGVGALAGKIGLSTLTQKMLGGVVAKQAAKIAEGSVATQGLAEGAKQAAMQAALPEATKLAAQRTAQALGAGIALYAQNIGMEAGDIYGGLVAESQKTGNPITGDDLLRAWGAAAVAAGTETATDLLGLGALTGRIPIGGTSLRSMTGVSGRAARAGAVAAGGVPIEAGQEYIQTWLEQYGAGQPTETAEARRERINAAAVGGMGGAVVGGGAGFLASATKPPVSLQPLPQITPPSTSIDESLAKLTQSQDVGEIVGAATELALPPIESPRPAAREVEQRALEQGFSLLPSLAEPATGPRTQEPQFEAAPTAMMRAFQEVQQQATHTMPDGTVMPGATHEEAIRDTQNQPRTPSPVGVGPEPVQAQPIAPAGAEAIAAGGSIQGNAPARIAAVQNALTPNAVGITMAEVEAIQDIPTTDKMREAVAAVGADEFQRQAQAKIAKYTPSTPDQEAMLVEATAIEIIAQQRRISGTIPVSAQNRRQTTIRAPVLRPAPGREQAAPEPWQMTRREYAKTLTTPSDFVALSNHRQYVQNALADGKPVSAEVLADYPDLKPTGQPAPEQGIPSPVPTPSAQPAPATAAFKPVSAVAELRPSIETLIRLKAEGKEVGLNVQPAIDRLKGVVAGKRAPKEVAGWLRVTAKKADKVSPKARDIAKAMRNTAAMLEAVSAAGVAKPTIPQPAATADNIGGKPVSEVALATLRQLAEKGGPAVQATAQKEIQRRLENREANKAQQELRDTPSNRFLNAVRKLGGIKTGEAIDIIGERNARTMGGMVARIFTKDGHGSDYMATLLHEQNWLTDEEYNDVDGGIQAVKDKIVDAIAGRLETVKSLSRRMEGERAKFEAGELSPEERYDLDQVIAEASAVLGEEQVETLKERIALEAATEREYADKLTEILHAEVAEVRNRSPAVQALPGAPGEDIEGGRPGAVPERPAAAARAEPAAEVTPQQPDRDKFFASVAAQNKRREELVEKLTAMLERDGGVKAVADDGRTILLSRGTTGAPYRVTHFDIDGIPTGHEEYDFIGGLSPINSAVSNFMSNDMKIIEPGQSALPPQETVPAQAPAEVAPALSLAAYTSEELKAKAEALQAAQAAQNQAVRNAEAAAMRAANKNEKARRAAEIVAERERAKKAEIDALAATFALGQTAPAPVVKTVTTEEAVGQGNLFAQPTAKRQETPAEFPSTQRGQEPEPTQAGKTRDQLYESIYADESVKIWDRDKRFRAAVRDRAQTISLDQYVQEIGDNRQSMAAGNAVRFLRSELGVTEKRAKELLAGVTPSRSQTVRFRGEAPDGGRTAGVTATANFLPTADVYRIAYEQLTTAPALSRTITPPARGLSVSEVESIIKPIVRNLAAPVTVYDSARALGDAFSVAVPADTLGLFYNGRIGLVASNLTTSLEVEQALWHEILHAGLDRLVKTGRESYARAVEYVAMANGNIRSRAALWRENYGTNFTADLRAFGVPAKEIPQRLQLRSYEEALADLSSENAQLTGIERFIAALEKLLRALGLKNLADWIEGKTNAEALSLIRRSREALTRGAEPVILTTENAPSYMVAWHGSPHDFDEFSVQKIGTGQGAATYGWGLYFAGKQEVAEHYRASLTGTIPGAFKGRSRYGIKGVEFPEGRAGHAALDTAQDIEMMLAWRHSGNAEMEDVAQNAIEGRIQRWQKEGTHEGVAGEHMQALVDFYKQHVAKATRDQVVRNSAGRVYQVNLAPAEDEYLLWDKPLSEQSEKVKAALQSTGLFRKQDWIANASSVYNRMAERAHVTPVWKDPVSYFWNRFEEELGRRITPEEATSRYLASIGIPGIKYLDQGSRNKWVIRQAVYGEPQYHRYHAVNETTGNTSPNFETRADAQAWLKRQEQFNTYNYVIFDDKLVNIEAKFSRSAPSQILSRAPDVVQDFLRSERTLNRVISKVNTPFYIGMTHRQFMPVVKLGLSFHETYNGIAISAADLARDLLPRIEYLRDVLPERMGGPKAPTQTDIEAVGRALYAGTLYGGGNPMKGVVWSDEELRGHETPGRPIPDNLKNNPLTDAQIKFYRQVLESMKYSLGETGKALIWRNGRNLDIALDRDMSMEDMAQIAKEQADELIADLTQQVQAAADTEVKGAADRIGALRAKITGLQDFKKEVSSITEKTHALQQRGYFPAMRFGDYFAYAEEINPDGARTQRHFGLYEGRGLKPSNMVANEAARAIQAKYPDAVVTTGTLSKEKAALFQGLSLDALEVFAEHIKKAMGGAGVMDPIMQEYFRMMADERSIWAREIHRKGVPGYSDDVPRVLAAFTLSNARQVSSIYHTADMMRAVENIDQGDLKDYAIRYIMDLQDPSEEAPAVRGLLANYYILGSIASTGVNLTQPSAITIPTLTQYTGYGHAADLVQQAARDVVKGRQSLSATERALVERAVKDGTIAPQELHQIRAESQASMFGKNLGWRKLAHGWGAMYSLAEQFNRGTSFLAAHRLAVENPAVFEHEDVVKAGATTPYEFSKYIVQETQFIYNRANRPELARGSGPLGIAGPVIMTFKQFTISYIELGVRLFRADKKAFAYFMLTLFALAGLEGLPFAEDIEDAIDTIGHKLGYATNTKKTLRHMVTDLLGKDIGQILLHGVSAIPGVPIDVAGRLGMHNIIPGSAMFKTSDPDKAQDIIQILGPVATLVKNVKDAMGGLMEGQGRAARKLLPMAAQHMVQGWEMADTGLYKDYLGRRVMDVTPMDAFYKAMGFQPAEVAAESRLVSEQNQDRALHNVMESSIALQWSQGLFERDEDKVQAAREKLRDWNEDNPELPIRITSRQIRERVKQMHRSREERFIRSMPPEIRRSARQEFLEAR